MKKTNILHVALLAFLLVLSSCDTSYFDNDFEDFTWDGGAEAPIGHITYSLSDLFKELGVEDFDEDTEGNLSISYTKSITGGSTDAYDVTIPNTTISSSVATPITDAQFALLGGSPATILAPLPGDIATTQDNEKVHVLNLDQSITNANYSDGQFIITLNSTFNSSVELTLNIPSVISKAGNIPYNEVITLKEEQKQVVIDLKDFNSNLTNDGTGFDKTVNTFVLRMNAQFDFQVGDVLRDTDQISYSAVLTGAKTEVVWGDFKQESFTVSNESIDLDFFGDFGDGTFTFANPTMKITARNGHGFPVGIDLSSVEAKNGAEVTKLTYDGTTADEKTLDDTIILDGIATYVKDGPSRVTERTLNKDNSNLVDLLAIKPTEFNINVSGTANPIDRAPNLNFFSTVNNGFDLDLEVIVPMEVKFENVGLTESVEFDGAEDVDDLKNIALFLKVENKIPLSGSLELVFLKNGVNLGIDKTLAAFDAADVDTDGKSTGYKTTNSQLSFSDADIQKLKEATDIDINFSLNSPSDKDSVVLLGTDDLKVTMGVKVEGEFGSDDN